MSTESKPIPLKNWIEKTLKERGIPIAPPDHWIYTEGASIAFVPRKPSGKKRKATKSETPPSEQGLKP